MAVARRVGWQMIPWATDYRTDTSAFWRGGWFAIGDNLRLADEAVHEWIGLAVYGVAGMAGKRDPVLRRSPVSARSLEPWLIWSPTASRWGQTRG